MDAFTMEMQLCDEDGNCDLATLSRLRQLNGNAAYEGPPFQCTGSCHPGRGQHIGCTSAFHKATPPDALSRSSEGHYVTRAFASPRAKSQIDIAALRDDAVAVSNPTHFMPYVSAATVLALVDGVLSLRAVCETSETESVEAIETAWEEAGAVLAKFDWTACG